MPWLCKRYCYIQKAENFVPQFPSLLQSASIQPVSPNRLGALRRRFGLGFRGNLDGTVTEQSRVFSPKCRRLSGP